MADKAGGADGRPRSASGLSLRPALGSMSRMRSRSLLKGSELATVGPSTSASTSSLGHFPEEEHAIQGDATTSAASSSYGGFESDLDTNTDSATTATDDSDLTGPITPSSDTFSNAAAVLAGKLPFPMPRRATFSRLAAAANPFSASSSTPPRLNRQQSYLSLSIPPTPGVGTSSSNLQLRGDDEDRRLPSPVTEAIEVRAQSTGLAARPLTSLSQVKAAPTTLSQRAANSPQSLSKLLPPVLFLLFLFSLSLLFIYYAISTIPVLSIPHNVSEIREESAALREYARRGWTEGVHVSAVLSAIFVFKQAFSVPGSILVNILFGSLYGTVSLTTPTFAICKLISDQSTRQLFAPASSLAWVQSAPTIWPASAHLWLSAIFPVL